MARTRFLQSIEIQSSECCSQQQSGMPTSYSSDLDPCPPVISLANPPSSEEAPRTCRLQAPCPSSAQFHEFISPSKDESPWPEEAPRTCRSQAPYLLPADLNEPAPIGFSSDNGETRISDPGHPHFHGFIRLSADGSPLIETKPHRMRKHLKHLATTVGGESVHPKSVLGAPLAIDPMPFANPSIITSIERSISPNLSMNHAFVHQKSHLGYPVQEPWGKIDNPMTRSIMEEKVVVPSKGELYDPEIHSFSDPCATSGIILPACEKGKWIETEPKPELNEPDRSQTLELPSDLRSPAKPPLFAKSALAYSGA